MARGWGVTLALGWFLSAALLTLAAPIQTVSIQFLGAAEMVGGACFLVEADRYKFLVDCGDLYVEEDEQNSIPSSLPPIPLDIEAVVLTHAHRDHWGRIPALVLRDGWRGRIFLTEVTRTLLGHPNHGSLRNALGNLDMGREDFRYSMGVCNVKNCDRDQCKQHQTAGDKCTECKVHSESGYAVDGRCCGRHDSGCKDDGGGSGCRCWEYAAGRLSSSWCQITCSRKDFEALHLRLCPNCLDYELKRITNLFVPHGYGDPWQIAPGIKATFLNATHIPGSAMVLLEFETASGPFRVLFSGDLGPGTHPFLIPPELPESPINVLVVEATYGDSVRKPHEEELERFRKELQRAIEQGHRVVIPVFALDRAQRLLYEIGKCKERDLIPADTPVYLGGGKGGECTGDVHDYTKLYVWLAQKSFHDEAYLTPEFFSVAPKFVAVQDFSKSQPYGYKCLSETGPIRNGPSIILATSADGRFSVSRKLTCDLAEDPNTEFFLVAYSDPKTPSGQLWEIARGNREQVELDCGVFRVTQDRVRGFGAFSGHPDARQLQEFVFSCDGLSAVFVTHGTRVSLEGFAARLRASDPKFEIVVPKLGARYTIVPGPPTRTSVVDAEELVAHGSWR